MKIRPITPISREQSLKYREKTLQERIDAIKVLRDGYPVGHSQIPAINGQIARLEALIEQGWKY